MQAESNREDSTQGGLARFGAAFAYEALEAPVQALLQLRNRTADTNLPEYHPVKPDQSAWSQAGSFAGMVAKYVVLSKFFHGATKSVTLDSTLVGGAAGALTPAEGGNNFWREKATNTLISGVTFGTISGGAAFLNETKLAQSMRSCTVRAATVNGVAGLGAGALESTLDATLHGRKLDLGEISRAAGQYALFGAAFGALGEHLLAPRRRSYKPELSPSPELSETTKTQAHKLHIDRAHSRTVNGDTAFAESTNAFDSTKMRVIVPIPHALPGFEEILSSLKNFTRQTQGWSSEVDFCRKLFVHLNKTLEEHNFPRLNRVYSEPMAAEGVYHYAEGTIGASYKLICEPKPNGAGYVAHSRLEQVLAHELKHLEQDYLMIRALADELHIGAKASDTDVRRLIARYQKTTPIEDNASSRSFVKECLTARAGARLAEEETSRAIRLLNGFVAKSLQGPVRDYWSSQANANNVVAHILDSPYISSQVQIAMLRDGLNLLTGWKAQLLPHFEHGKAIADIRSVLDPASYANRSYFPTAESLAPYFKNAASRAKQKQFSLYRAEPHEKEAFTLQDAVANSDKL